MIAWSHCCEDDLGSNLGGLAYVESLGCGLRLGCFYWACALIDIAGNCLFGFCANHCCCFVVHRDVPLYI
jgi:hypothetical protein